MVDHYEEGCVGVFRDDKGRELSFRTELIQAYRNQQADRDCTLSQPCKEWWDKLRFLIGFSSYNLSDEHKLEDDYVLHAALTVPDTPTSLVEFLVRLVPSTRYETDPATGALPVHLACKYWIGYTTSKKEQRLSSQVLHLLLAGDSSLAWKRFKRRLPLHHAILSGKPLSFLQTLLAMDVKTANARDPLTRLFPFQLAAMESPNPRLSLDVYSRSTKSLGEDTGGLDVIYELLRANPIAVYPMKACGSGDPKGDIGPVAQHVLNYCYFYRKGGSETGWILNERRTKTLRDAISKGRMPENMKKWYGQLKQMIWKVYNERNTGKRVGLLPQKDEYLLHAALSNGGTPPIVIELMLELYPNSVHMRIPGTDKYPIHIAAASPSYARLPFEKTVSMGSALEMIALVDKDSLHLRSTGRSPLHIAIDGGKTWDELCPLIDAEPDFLAEPDLCSGLFPFQQVAAIETFTPTHQVSLRLTNVSKCLNSGAHNFFL